MCVDGQQRVTTTSLFLAALADHLSRLAEKCEQQEECRDNIRLLEFFLFNDAAEVERLRQTSPTSEATSFYPFLRLLPSARDRKPYLMAVLGLRCGQAIIGNEY